MHSGGRGHRFSLNVTQGHFLPESMMLLEAWTSSLPHDGSKKCSPGVLGEASSWEREPVGGCHP